MPIEEEEEEEDDTIIDLALNLFLFFSFLLCWDQNYLQGFDCNLSSSQIASWLISLHIPTCTYDLSVLSGCIM